MPLVEAPAGFTFLWRPLRPIARACAPFPDSSVIVRLAWRYQSSPRNDQVFPVPQSFVSDEPINVQVSVKDSKRYAATAGWDYGQVRGRHGQSERGGGSGVLRPPLEAGKAQELRRLRLHELFSLTRIVRLKRLKHISSNRAEKRRMLLLLAKMRHR
jgi:hypothetical protein